MDAERLLVKLVDFINERVEETDERMRELRKKASLLESMEFLERLNYLQEVAETKGKIDLLTAVKKHYSSITSNG